MFKLTRRSSTAVLVAAAFGSGLAASPASAHAGPAGPTAISTAATPEPVALLLPAVQKVREAAARMKCVS